MAQKIILAGNAITAQILHSYLVADPRYRLVGSPSTTSSSRRAAWASCPRCRSRACFGVPGRRVSRPHAIGYSDLNRVRESVFARLKAMGYAIETYVHPGARVHSQVPLGEGSVFLPGAVIEPFVSVGTNAMVWANVTLAHHCSVAEHCWVASGRWSPARRGSAATHSSGWRHDRERRHGRRVQHRRAAALVSRDTRPHSVHLRVRRSRCATRPTSTRSTSSSDMDKRLVAILAEVFGLKPADVRPS